MVIPVNTKVKIVEGESIGRTGTVIKVNDGDNRNGFDPTYLVLVNDDGTRYRKFCKAEQLRRIA